MTAATVDLPPTVESGEMNAQQEQQQLTRGLMIALVLNVLATACSFLGFAFSGSFSLLADAIHM